MRPVIAHIHQIHGFYVYIAGGETNRARGLYPTELGLGMTVTRLKGRLPVVSVFVVRSYARVYVSYSARNAWFSRLNQAPLCA